MSTYRVRDNAGAGDWIMGAVTRNPEGLLLLAAGAALLMRSGRGQSSRRSYAESVRETGMDAERSSIKMSRLALENESVKQLGVPETTCLRQQIGCPKRRVRMHPQRRIMRMMQHIWRRRDQGTWPIRLERRQITLSRNNPGRLP